MTSVCAFIAASTAGVIAQNSAVPDIRPGSLEIAWHVSHDSAPTGVPDPRFAETLTDLGRSQGQLWHRFSARIYWTRFISTMVEGGVTTWGIREYRTRSPVLPLAFQHDTLQHRRAVSVVQSVDLIPRGRTVPWVGGGIVVHRTSSRECVVSAGRGFSGCTRRLVEDTAALAAGGVRVYLDRHAFVSGGGGLGIGDAPPEGFRGYWQAGGGVAF